MNEPTTSSDNVEITTPFDFTAKPLIGISLYSGAMGLDQGLELGARVNFLLAADSFRAARATIRANRPGIKVLEDASRLTASMVRKAAGLSSADVIDVVSGCPPCPPWSVAGKRLGVTDPRGMLLPGFIDLAIALAPRLIIHENVKGLVSAELGGAKGSLLRMLVQELRRNGYRVTWEVFNAADFGAPQNRERLILVACREADPVMPVPTHSKDGTGGLPVWRTLRDALSGLPSIPCDHVGYSPGMLRFMKHIGPGQWWKHLPHELQLQAVTEAYHKGGGGTGTLRRLSWDKPCPTVTCSVAQKMTTLGHPDEDRPLSIQEVMRCQGFPDDWRIMGSVAERYTQVGNAVPVQLSLEIGRCIAATLERTGCKGGHKCGENQQVRASKITPPTNHLSGSVSKKGAGVLTWFIRIKNDQCPGSTPKCFRCCYARQNNCRLNNARHDQNFAFCKHDDFVEQMEAEIRYAATQANGKTIAVSLHGRGDLFSIPYLLKWQKVMELTADCQNLVYYVYSRMWIFDEYRTELESIGRNFTNVRINLSADEDNARDHGIPSRIGNGRISWLAETDTDLPPEGADVDIVFRNTAQRRLPPAEFLDGFRVCPNESRLFFSSGSSKPNDKPERITCGECRLCIDRSFTDWDEIKDKHRLDPGLELTGGSIS